jgi:hypothetical protein
VRIRVSGPPELHKHWRFATGFRYSSIRASFPDLDRSNVEVRPLDIRTTDLEDERYDLVHPSGLSPS